MDGNLLLIGVSEPGVQSWGSYYFSDAREDRCWCWVTFVVPGFSLDAGLLRGVPTSTLGRCAVCLSQNGPGQRCDGIRELARATVATRPSECLQVKRNWRSDKASGCIGEKDMDPSRRGSHSGPAGGMRRILALTLLAFLWEGRVMRGGLGCQRLGCQATRKSDGITAHRQKQANERCMAFLSRETTRLRVDEA